MKILASMLLVIALAACGPNAETEEDTDVAASPPSQLNINSAKRQCTIAASMSMIGSGAPEEAIKQVCDCSIDRLLENGSFTSEVQPDEAASDEALNFCVDQLAAQMAEAGS
uniref:hypothetical protein n=1 Tax=uncultured Erythrobacter sp. TaxID=263913 RepID=UPI00262C526A|nr:hypothetical protein [uncultured Erythrobacter sp.]